MRNRGGHLSVQNALQIGTDSEGGYLVPDEYERTLVDALREENRPARPVQDHPHVLRRPQDPAGSFPRHGRAGSRRKARSPNPDDAFGQITIARAQDRVHDQGFRMSLLQDSVFDI